MRVGGRSNGRPPLVTRDLGPVTDEGSPDDREPIRRKPDLRLPIPDFRHPDSGHVRWALAISAPPGNSRPETLVRPDDSGCCPRQDERHR